jgi:hypothetical protein
MNTEQQRIAIAEWMGVHLDSHFAKWKLLGEGWRECEVCGRKQAACYEWPICGYPNIKIQDYPNNLNAMHEAEKKLTGIQCLRYADELNKATKCFRHITPLIMCMASADKRSEALCRTLWTERFK